MTTYYSKEVGTKDLDYGVGHTDSLTITEGEQSVEFWNDEIDDLIKAIKELNIERNRIKKINEDF